MAARPHPRHEASKEAGEGERLSSWRRGRARRGRLGWWLVSAYAVLLLVSHVVDPGPSVPEDPGLSRARVVVAAPVEGVTADALEIAWREWHADASGLPVVLLHGSPGSSSVFRRLAADGGDRRLLAPDLPGFGASTRDVPSYSIRAHARYVRAWLDALG
ncbi:MAG: alpha/beta fold hydrolase, partial [Thermoanaerobaculia bacterium]|nr:alpha/beta fold hydrolase [Thermoanaerobaculia bacterium]